MSATPLIHPSATLIDRLDEAVADPDVECCANRVKEVLEELIFSGCDFLAPELLRPDPQRYARRLVHRDPALRYTVLAMVWGPGQGTPLHDHAGMWCVECVYRGRIRVTSYSLESRLDEPVLRFARETEIVAGVGEAGALIPPFEYHTIANADATPSVTLHVYGGEMTHCAAFEPVSGGYQRVERTLCYTAD